MSESHNIEYKESWRDEYLKWISGFANAGLSAPVFEATMGGIMITIERGVRNSMTPEGKAIVTDNVTDNFTESRLVLIMKEIKLNPNISYNQLSKILDVTRMTVYRDIEKLKEGGRIKRIGSAKGGHWEVIQK
jgi:ATP-dependent DNA helicase RecG